MGKTMTNLPVHNPGQEDLSGAHNPLVAVTSEATSTMPREKDVGLGDQPHNAGTPNKIEGVLIEDCDEDGGEGSDPPTRSFFQRRLEEQSRQFEQTFSREIKGILKGIRGYSAVHTRLLEVLVNNTQNIGYADQSRQPIPKSSSITAPLAETESAQLKMINLAKKGGLSSKMDDFVQNAETVSVDVIEVQRMIDSALKKGPKFPKFIHPYPAYEEKFEYPKGYKIPDFSLFAGESSLSSLEHVA
ncbi:hypothetical protein ACFX2H_014662 [Malus domestica]